MHPLGLTEAEHEAETIIKRYDELQAELAARQARAEAAEGRLAEAEDRLSEAEEKALGLEEELRITMEQVWTWDKCGYMESMNTLSLQNLSLNRGIPGLPRSTEFNGHMILFPHPNSTIIPQF